jgi:hypothetical protein
MEDNLPPPALDLSAPPSLSPSTPGLLSPLAAGAPSSSMLPDSMVASGTCSLALAQTEAPVDSLPVVAIAPSAAAAMPMEEVAQAAVGSSLNPLIPMLGAVSNVGTQCELFWL